MSQIFWFKRGDGQLFAAEGSSAQFKLMSTSGEFTPCDADGNDLDESNVESQESDLADAGKTGDAGQSGAAKRGGARSKNKAKSS